MSLEAPPSVRWLLEEVRAPGVARADVDALLSGLELPLGPGETARERADSLHDILGDAQVREYTGSGGRKVGHVAVLRLAELGFPYALEVPPELFAEARGTGRGGFSLERTSNGTAGRWMVVIAGAVESLPALFVASEGRADDVAGALLWFLLVALTSFVPAFLADVESVLRRRWLHFLMLLAIALPALPWLLATALLFGVFADKGELGLTFLSLFPLGMAALRLGSAKVLYGPSPDELPPARDSD